MKRIGRIFLFFLLCSLLHLRGVVMLHLRGGVFSKAYASTEFETSYNVRYEVLTTGITHVSQNISLTNKLANVYATKYSMILQTWQIENVTASDKEGPLKIDIQKTDNQTEIKLSFNEKVVGKDKTLNFTLSYDVHDLATKTGQIWEVIVPKLADPSQIDNYTLTLAVPQNFGQLAFINPNPVEQKQEGDLLVYRFTKNQLTVSGVNAAFGQFQIFDFVLSYHLQNPHLTAAITEIALPPDTAYQQVFYHKIDPSPLDVEIDSDGNWLASFKLDGGEKLNIVATGKAKIFAQPINIFSPPTTKTLAKNLVSQPYWPIDDSLIQEKAESLNTPKEIYDFVIKTLDYDFSRVEEGVERLGAVQALKEPQKAICMEFTDLFIALARAAGIPAREINGYSYTTNPKLRPLSLVADVLHSWPEYWDEKKKIWVPIDPTWEKTTGGVDYFNKLDLHHFVFVIHGQSSEEPYPPGSYKSNDSLAKDIQVAFGQYETEVSPQLEVELAIPDELYFEVEGKGRVIVKNNGPAAAYNLPLKIEAVNFSLNSPPDDEVDALPPFGQEEMPIRFSSQLFKLGQGTLVVFLNGQQFSRSIKLKSLLLEKVLPLVILLTFLTFVFLRVKNKRERFVFFWRNKFRR